MSVQRRKPITGGKVADRRGSARTAAKKAPTLSEVEHQRLMRALARVMKPDFVAEWLQAPNDAFGGLKPLEVIRRGETDRIWRMIHVLESGVPG